MTKTAYFRKDNLIQNSLGEIVVYKSINAAKRESRQIQKREGLGAVRAVQKLPFSSPDNDS